MRTYFTTHEALGRGVTESQLRWGEKRGRWRRISRGVYGEGPDEPDAFDRAVGAVVLTGGVATGSLAGVLHGLDGVSLRVPEITVPAGRSARRAGVRRRHLPLERTTFVRGVRCTDGVQTLVDLAASLDDLGWEQALESALRKRLVSVADLVAALPVMGRARTPGTNRVRRVLRLRPPGARATESLLETLFVQLARSVAGLGEPVRQLEVRDRYGQFIARVDLAWPDLGLFVELDGQHHRHQPLYDARRETAVVAATGWLCARFTWSEVVRCPTATARRLAGLADQARRRPLVDRRA